MGCKIWNFDWNIPDFERNVKKFYPHVRDFVDFDRIDWYFYRNNKDFDWSDEISTEMFETFTEIWELYQNVQYFD